MSIHDDVASQIHAGEPGLLQGKAGGQLASFRANGANILISAGPIDPASAFGGILDGIANGKPGYIMSTSGVPREIFEARATAYETFVVFDTSLTSPKSCEEWARILRAFVVAHYDS